MQASGTGVTSATATSTSPSRRRSTSPSDHRQRSAGPGLSQPGRRSAGRRCLHHRDQRRRRRGSALDAAPRLSGTGQLVLPVGRGRVQQPSALFPGPGQHGHRDGHGERDGLPAERAHDDPGAVRLRHQPFQLGNFTTTTLATRPDVQLLPAQLNPGDPQLFDEPSGARRPRRERDSYGDRSAHGRHRRGHDRREPGRLQRRRQLRRTSSFVPGGAGTSQIPVGTPTGFSFSTPGNSRSVTATVTAPAITSRPRPSARSSRPRAGLSLGAPAPAGGAPGHADQRRPDQASLSTSATTRAPGRSSSPSTPARTRPDHGVLRPGPGRHRHGHSDRDRAGLSTSTGRHGHAGALRLRHQPVPARQLHHHDALANQTVQLLPARLTTPDPHLGDEPDLRPGLAPSSSSR